MLKKPNKKAIRNALPPRPVRPTRPTAPAPARQRTPSARLVSTPSTPLVTFQTYKLRQETVDTLARIAAARGWSTAALVRDVLDGWAKRHGGGAGGKK